MKRSQIEMFGLMILVVLVAISLIIALRFIIGGSTQETPTESRLNSQAINLQMALLKLTVCENNDFENLIVGCCTNQNVCNENACNLAKNIIRNVTLEVLPNQGYKMKFLSATGDCLSIEEGTCTDYVTSDYPVRFSGSNYKFSVAVCKK